MQKRCPNLQLRGILIVVVGVDLVTRGGRRRREGEVVGRWWFDAYNGSGKAVVGVNPLVTLIEGNQGLGSRQPRQAGTRSRSTTQLEMTGWLALLISGSVLQAGTPAFIELNVELHNVNLKSSQVRQI